MDAISREFKSEAPGLYLHFPFCVKKCDYCSFYSFSFSRLRYDDYLVALFRDLHALDFFFEGGLLPDTLYLGGGTPSLFETRDLERIVSHLSARYPLREITLEINPATVSREKIKEYRTLGINRISLGVQSLDDRALHFLGRVHTAKEAMETADHVSSTFDNFGIDLIFGIPGFSIFPFESTLRFLERCRPSHISAYALSVEEGTPLADRGTTLSEDQFCEEYIFLHECLGKKGYIHYEISNFCRPSRESIHNRKYWNRAPYLGIGPAAHSLWHGKRFSYENWDDFLTGSLVEKYRGALPLTPQEIIEEKIMLSARTLEGIAIELLSPRATNCLQNMQENRLMVRKGKKAFATLQGWMVLNSLILKLIEE